MDDEIIYGFFCVVLIISALLLLRQIIGFIRGCFFHKKDIDLIIRWFTLIRKNEIYLQNKAVFISNFIYTHYGWFFPKYLQMDIFVDTPQSATAAHNLGMEVSDNSKPKNPSYCCKFVLKRRMTGLERMLVLFRIYDRIEDEYQQDKVEFHPIQKQINIYFR